MTYNPYPFQVVREVNDAAKKPKLVQNERSKVTLALDLSGLEEDIAAELKFQINQITEQLATVKRDQDEHLQKMNSLIDLLGSFIEERREVDARLGKALTRVEDALNQ